MNAAGDPAPVERRAWSSIAWVAGSLAAVAAMVFAWDPPPRPEAAAAAAELSLALPALPDPSVPVGGAEPDAASTALSPNGASGTELIEVCGVGWVPPSPSGAPERSAVAADPDVVASQRALLDALRRGDGEVGRAVATFLELHGATRTGADSDPWLAVAASCKAADCSGASEEDRQHVSKTLEQLARQASTTGDPRVYALAMTACAPFGSTGSCALLNTDQWARLDDGNALPWLHMLERAQARNDPAAINEALYRIGAAARFEERTFAAAGRIAENAAASDVDLIAAQLLAVDALLHMSSLPAPFWSLSRACNASALADANRRQLCEHAAETLSERSDTLMAVLTGSAIGRRLGWANDRLDSLKALQYASTAMARQGRLVVETPTSGEVSTSCRAARSILTLFARQGRVGEVQAIRDWLAENGKSIAPYAREAHDVRERREEAQEAAVAAQEASAPATTLASAAAAVDAASAPSAAPAPSAPPAAVAASAPVDVPRASSGVTPYSAAPPPDR